MTPTITTSTTTFINFGFFEEEFFHQKAYGKCQSNKNQYVLKDGINHFLTISEVGRRLMQQDTQKHS